MLHFSLKTESFMAFLCIRVVCGVECGDYWPTSRLSVSIFIDIIFIILNITAKSFCCLFIYWPMEGSSRNLATYGSALTVLCAVVF